jgi:hypothetical protein
MRLRPKRAGRRATLAGAAGGGDEDRSSAVLFVLSLLSAGTAVYFGVTDSWATLFTVFGCLGAVSFAASAFRARAFERADREEARARQARVEAERRRSADID